MNAKEQKKQAQIERRRAALESEADKLAARIKKSADLILGVGIKKATGARADRLQAAYKRDTKALRSIEARLLLLEQTGSNPATWTAKQERQYKAIEKSEMKRGASKKTAKRIAAATVNKRRAANPGNIEHDILTTARRVGTSGGRVYIVDVKDALREEGYSNAQIDAGLLALGRSGKIALMQLDDPQERTPRILRYAMKSPHGHQDNHIFYVRNPKKKTRRAGNPSPAQIRARKAFAKMAKERARAAKSKRARNPRYIIRATDASGSERELAILQSPNKTQAVARAKSLYKGHKKYTAELIDKDDFIGGRPGTQRLKRKRARKANGVAKTAGRALKKIGGAVLGGVSKVAGKGAKALSNPSDVKTIISRAPEGYRKKFPGWIIRRMVKWEGKWEGLDFVGISFKTKQEAQKYLREHPYLSENPKRRRNLDHKDSHHQIEVRKHWRAGGLSQWQRAHHAGQHDLFAHGIKAKPRRNPKKRVKKAPHRGRSVSEQLKAAQLRKLKLFGKALKAFPSSPIQKRIHRDVMKMHALEERLKARIARGENPKAKRNPSASGIRKKFAGRVSGSRTLYFPKGAPNGMAKLGRLVSMKLKGGKVIKPARRNPAPEIWLCSDTHGKLWLGSTKPGRLYDGAPGDLGTMTNIEYAESKPHLGYPDQTIWFHKLGEVSGRCPHLVVNDDGDLIIKGGAYKITRAGIVD